MNDEKYAYMQQVAKRWAGQGPEMSLAMQMVAGFNAIHTVLLQLGEAETAAIVDDLSRLAAGTSVIPIEVWERAMSEYRRVLEGARMFDDDPMPGAQGVH